MERKKQKLRPRVKICCISSPEEASIAIQYGASALGLVSEMPSGPGVITPKLIAEIAAGVPPGVSAFLLTSKTTAEEIIEQQKQCRCSTLQLTDYTEPKVHEELRTALPGIKIVQVIHVTGEESIYTAQKYAETADALLLDSGNTNLAVKELGGTGRTHDWSLSRRIRESMNKPLFLAGGLKPENVREAIDVVSPYGLDICSGVRTAGKLDPDKLERFMKEAGYSNTIKG